MKGLTTLLCLVSAVGPVVGQLPYKTTHPRLPGPDAAFMAALQANPTQLAKVINFANQLDPTVTYLNQIKIRDTIIAYKATGNAAYLEKMEMVAAHPLTGFGVASRIYVLAIIYDWLYDDLSTATRNLLVNRLLAECGNWQYEYDVYPRYSPFNSTGWNRCSAGVIWGAIALHPDVPQGLYWINYAADMLINRWLPVWRRYMQEGGWHEGMEYRTYLAKTVYLAMAAASSAVQTDLFQWEPFLRNSLYYPIYAKLPDTSMCRRGDVAGWYTFKGAPYWASFPDYPALARTFDDPLGYWVATNGVGVDNNAFGPAIPSHFPWGTPFPATVPMTNPNGLPTDYYFAGIQHLIMRSNWTEDAVYAEFGVDPGNWSHSGLDSGHFFIYSRGGLAIDSGAYGSGSNTEHWRMYGSSAAAHNVMLFHDAADQSSTGSLMVYTQPGVYSVITVPNDGGFHRHRDGWVGITLPYSIQERDARAAEFNYGALVNHQIHAEWVLGQADLDAAYNPPLMNQPAHIRRTHRLNQYDRTFLFLKPDVFVVLDRFDLSNAAVTPKFLLHTINQPQITGNKVTALRTESVYNQFDGWPSGLQYRASDPHYYNYNGKLVMTTLLPQSPTITTVGGAGSEFQIGSVNYDGYANWPQYMSPDPTIGPVEAGSWRVEITRNGTQPANDAFLHVLQAGTPQSTQYTATLVPGQGNFVGAQVTGGSSPRAAIFARWGPLTGTTTFTLTGSGTFKVLVADLPPNAACMVSATNGSGATSVSPTSVQASAKGVAWFALPVSGTANVTFEVP